MQQTLPGARSAVIGMYCKTRQLRHSGFVSVKTGATDDDSVVLQHIEPVNFHLEEIAPALDQNTFGLQRLDEPQNAADVLDARLTQFFKRVLGHHRADAAIREKL